MAFKLFLLASSLVSVGLCQQLQQPRTASSSSFDPFKLDLTLNDRASTTPVPILRFVDKQHPDGSYTYGYESGDGSYKIETRYATGDVKGKYGYYDTNGSLREVEYGATPTGGFEPKGQGIDIAPPTLINTVQQQQQQQPRQPEQLAATPAKTVSDSHVDGRRVVVRKKGAPAAAAAAPLQEPVQPFVPVVVDPHRFDGHPANNINLNTGSYTVRYGRKK